MTQQKMTAALIVKVRFRDPSIPDRTFIGGEVFQLQDNWLVIVRPSGGQQGIPVAVYPRELVLEVGVSELAIGKV